MIECNVAAQEAEKARDEFAKTLGIPTAAEVNVEMGIPPAEPSTDMMQNIIEETGFAVILNNTNYTQEQIQDAYAALSDGGEKFVCKQRTLHNRTI